MKFQVAYFPIGVGTFHLESAGAEFEKSKEMLRAIDPEVVCPKEMLLSIDLLKEYMEGLHPDLIILQNITFANAAYASEVLNHFDCPILLWTLREPVIDGGRLRLNSLTGAYSAGGAITAFREETFEYVFGGPCEEEVQKEVRAMVLAAKVKKELKNSKMTAIGHTPQGFGFGRALDSEMMKTFGVTLESIEARELIELAKSYSEDDCKSELEEAKGLMCGLEKTPEKNVVDFTRLYKAYKTYIEEHEVDAISSRCWPDFFTSFGTPVCGVLSMLNALGVASSCEADVYGALSMLVGTKLTDAATFFGDPVSMDEKENSITFWHCGMAACNLARNDTGATVGVHPNRKIGPVMDFGCKAATDVTVFRIGRKKDGTFRFFIAEGEALDKEKQFQGTSVVIKPDASAKKIVYDTVKCGWEPHYVVIYNRVGLELEKLANMLQIEVCKY